jgi:hypothetical protein
MDHCCSTCPWWVTNILNCHLQTACIMVLHPAIHAPCCHLTFNSILHVVITTFHSPLHYAHSSPPPSTTCWPVKTVNSFGWVTLHSFRFHWVLLSFLFTSPVSYSFPATALPTFLYFSLIPPHCVEQKIQNILCHVVALFNVQKICFLHLNFNSSPYNGLAPGILSAHRFCSQQVSHSRKTAFLHGWKNFEESTKYVLTAIFV